MANNETKKSMMDRFCWFMSRHRLIVLVLVVITAAIVGAGVVKMQGEVILQHLFPYDHPYLKLHARFSEVFGSGASGVAIALKARNGDIFNEATLTKVKNINEEIVFWDEIYRILTISIASPMAKVVKPMGKGEIVIDAMMWPDVPKNDKEMAELKKNIFSNEAYRGFFVSGDGTAALIFTEFKENISYQRVYELLRGLAAKYTDDQTSVHIVGYPMLMGWIYSLKPQIVNVFIVSVALMVLILFIIFRNLAGMMAPICFGIICTAYGLGFVGYTGINFSPLLYVLAFLVGGRLVSHSVQISSRYLEEINDAGGDKLKACYETMRSMLVPNLAGITTDVAGFSVLFLAKIPLMQQVALIMSFWMLTVGLCGLVTPILCSYIPMRKASEVWSKGRKHMTWLDRLCMAISGFSIGSGKYVVGAVVIGMLIFCGMKSFSQKIGDPTPGTPLLWPDHTYNTDQGLVDRIFDASSENFMLFYEGKEESVYEPEVLTTFEAFDRYMKEKLPDIYKSSSSVIDLIRMVNVTLHDGDKIWYQLPRNADILSSILGYVRSNTGRGTINRFIDGTVQRAQITLFFADHTSENLERIRKTAYGFFKDRPTKTENGEFKLAGGRIGLEMAVNDAIAETHAKIDAMVLGAIFILCLLFYRSIVASLMLTLPLILANMVAFAYMSLNNIGLSINTLPIAAVGVGVGVDFAIYIYSRVMEEYPKAQDWVESIMVSVRTSGKAVVFTGLTMILPIMTWYFISELKFQAQMGIFLAMIMGTNVILSLTLHPLMIYIIKPRFVRRQVASTGRGH